MNKHKKGDSPTVDRENKSTEVEVQTVSVTDKMADRSSDSNWASQTMRGFRRGPSGAPFQPSSSPVSSSTVHTSTSQSTVTQNRDTDSTYQTPISKERYCHFFVNKGKCNYENSTGRKCKFLHKMAPKCKNGNNCRLNKCMYSHDAHDTSFLPNMTNIPAYVNPWTFANPWGDQAQFGGPWNWRGPSPRNQNLQQDQNWRENQSQ